MYRITFYFEQSGLSPVLLKRVKPGQNLLEIALGNGVALNHSCGGVCACSTCHIYIRQGQAIFDKPEKRESDYIAMAGNMQADSRLACQCVLPEGGGELVITLPVQSV